MKRRQTATRVSLLTLSALALDTFPEASAGKHSSCRHDENCGAADCPAAAAGRRREDAQACAWSKLTPPTGGGPNGSYYHLDGRPIPCGTQLLLQKLVYEGDDYGEFTRLLQEGQPVRFELDGGRPVLYLSVGGHDATIRYHEWLRFRWPAGGGR